MSGLTERDVRTIPQREVCQDGTTAFYTVPRNRIAAISGMHVDATGLSGQNGGGPIRIQIRDAFLALGAVASSEVIRFQTDVLAGDAGDIALPGAIRAFGSVRINSNFSGPVVTLGTVFE